MARSQRFKQRLAIVGPPLALLIIGAAVYITVVKLTQPNSQTIEAVPQTSHKSIDPPQASATATVTTITTEVSKPSAAKVTAWQQAAEAGRESWRLDVLQAAKQLGQDYGFESKDPFSLQQEASSSANLKTRQIQAIHQGKTYLITMYQPGLSGTKGIWAVEKIEVK